jgi:hypothetical protein
MKCRRPEQGAGDEIIAGEFLDRHIERDIGPAFMALVMDLA